MIQEAQVGWEPAFVEHQPPLGTKLFLLYLLFVIAISILRSVSVIRQLWILRGKVAEKRQSASDFSRVEGACSTKVRAMQRSAILTFFASVFVTAWQAKAKFVGLAMEKVTAPAWIWSSMAEIAQVFTIGIFVCVAVYAFVSFCEGTLLRWKNRIEQAKSLRARSCFSHQSLG